MYKSLTVLSGDKSKSIKAPVPPRILKVCSRMPPLAFLLLLCLKGAFTATIVFNPQYHYSYNYDISVVTKLRSENRSVIGLQTHFDIHPITPDSYIIEFTDAKLIANGKIEQIEDRLLQELKAPFLVRKVQSSAVYPHSYKVVFTHKQESPKSQNYKKGLITLLEVEYKPEDRSYNAPQETVDGVCLNKYVSHSHSAAAAAGGGGERVVTIGRTKDPVDCVRKNAHTTEFSTIVSPHPKLEARRHVFYNYHVKNTADGPAIILEANGTEEVRLDLGRIEGLTPAVLAQQKLRLAHAMKHSESSHYKAKYAAIFPEQPVTGATTNPDHIESTIEGARYFEPIHKRFTAQEAAQKFVDLAKIAETHFQSDLDNIDAENLIGNLSYAIWSMNSSELKELYKAGEGQLSFQTRMGTFYNLAASSLKLGPMKTLFEITQEHVAKGVEIDFVTTLLAQVLSSTTIRDVNFTKATADEFLTLCSTELISTNVDLKKACWLSFARTVDIHCTTGNLHCSPTDANDYATKLLQILNTSPEDIEQTILLVKVLRALKAPVSLKRLMEIVQDKSANIDLRVEAAWGVAMFPVLDAYKTVILDTVNNIKEEAGVRLAFFHGMLWHYPTELLPTVTRMRSLLASGSYDESRQFIVMTYTLLKRVINSYHHHRNPNITRGIHMLYDILREDFEKYYGQPDIFDGQVRFYGENQVGTIISQTSSSRGVLPAAIYFSRSDPLVRNSITVQSYSLGTLSYSEENPTDAPAIMAKVLELLKFKQNENVPATIIGMQVDGYDTFYAYFGPKSAPSVNTLKVLRGKVINLPFYIAYGSQTDSGIPYAFVSFQRMQIFNKFDTLVRFAQHSRVDSTTVAQLPFSGYRLKSGKESKKALRFIFGTECAKGECTVSAFDKNTTSMDIYYDKYSEYDYITNKFGFVSGLKDSLDGNDVFVSRKSPGMGLTLQAKYPSKQPERPQPSLADAFRWFPTQTLFTKKNCPHEFKVTLSVPESLKVIRVAIEASKDIGKLALKISDTQKPLYTLSFGTPGMDYKTRRQNLSIRGIDHTSQVGHELELQFKAPDSSVSARPERYLENVRPAELVGSLSYIDGVTESSQGKKTTYAQLKGVYSKNTSQSSELEYTNKEKKCSQKHVKKCEHARRLDIFRYDILDLDIEITDKETPPKFFHFLDHSLYRKYKQYSDYDLGLKTKSPKDYKIIYESYSKDGEKFKNMKFRKHYGQVQYLNVPALPVNLIFPYSVVKPRTALADFIPAFERERCMFSEAKVETYDGAALTTAQKSEDTKARLVTGECEKKRFLVLKQSNGFDIYNKKVKVTIVNASSAYVDGKLLSAQPGDVYESANREVVVMPLQMNNIRAYTVSFDDLDLFVLQNRIYAYPSHSFKGKLCGICGNYDGDWNNDVSSPSGELVSPNQYYDSWSFQNSSVSTA